MKKLALIVFIASLSNSVFARDFLCTAGGVYSLANQKTVSFNASKSETKPIAKIGNKTIQIAFDASNHDGKPYLSIEIVEVVTVSPQPLASVKSAKGSASDIVLYTEATSNGENSSIGCGPVN